MNILTKQKSKEINKKQTSIIYANEADLLNVALFGLTAKEWRTIYNYIRANNINTLDD